MEHRLELAIFLSRISFLSPRDKYKLFFSVDTVQSLLPMDTFALSRILERTIRSKNWNPKLTLYETTLTLRWLNQKKGWACLCTSSEYPQKLRHIADPPIILYGKGNSAALHKKSIAIVGTRHPSTSGMIGTQNIACYFASLGWNIVSGLAYGIDMYAHKKILEQKQGCFVDNKEDAYKKCNLVAVLGTGIDRIYPTRHLQYGKQILHSGGVIVSELPPMAEALVRKHSFIARNRIISGLCDHVFVIQCPKKSGALATADFALEQGRQVWIHSAGLEHGFDGTRRLYEDGAQIIDVLIHSIENSFLEKE